MKLLDVKLLMTELHDLLDYDNDHDNELAQKRRDLRPAPPLSSPHEFGGDPAKRRSGFPFGRELRAERPPKACGNDNKRLTSRKFYNLLKS